MIGRFCKIINDDGSRCTWPVEKAIEYCWVHDPKNPPILFIEDYKKRSGLKVVTKKQADYYIKKGVAIKATMGIVESYIKVIKKEFQEKWQFDLWQ